MKNTIKIKKIINKLHIYVFQDNELVEEYQEESDKQRLEGNIYLGKVTDVIKGMQAAFVDIGEERNALIHIKDIVPKESNVTGNLNMDNDKYSIQDLLKPGDKILVQIKRDCDAKKGSRVTKDIKLTGKYIVLMPDSKFVTTSLKITDQDERERLKNIVSNILKSEYGAIIRTSAIGISEKVLKDEINELKDRWQYIQEKAAKTKIVPTELYNNYGIIGKLITDFEPNGLEIVVENNKTKKIIEDIIKQKDENAKLQSNIVIKVEPIEMIEEFKRKVWLKCGGFITIDKCEALTAIDVNSGKFTGKEQLEDTVLKVNLEATKEIAKQMRLRDIGGIIVVDFIDMEKREDRDKVREQMIEEIKSDRSKVQVLEFTKLGLLEITRKHILGR